MRKKKIKLKNTPQVKEYNKALSKAEQIRKIYGKDFGIKDIRKVAQYLRQKGYVSLATLLEQKL